jgi:HAD superfamily hydrolase (TIGR01490 family)
VIAFFDMDRTLLSENTGALWTRHLRKSGEISFAGMLRSSWWIALYSLALLDMDTVARRVVAGMEGASEDALREKCRRWMHDEVARFIQEGGRRRIGEHRAAGEQCVILSSSSPYATGPLAEMLGMDAVVCSRLEVEGGRFTGRIVAPLCYGEGKVVWAERYAAERGARLEDCAFYTDSYTDLPMLARVGRPRIVNPDLRLRREARRRGWPIEEWA